MELVKVSKIFDIQYGNSFELINFDQDEFGVNFISRTSSNNGVSAKVKICNDIKPFDGEMLTVSLGGSVLETFFQTKPFYTGFHIFVLKPKIKMSEREMIYYSICIKKNKYKYSYGRQANRTLRDLLIPAKVPDKFLKLQVSEPNKKSVSNKKITLKEREWRWFNYPEVFEIKKGYYNNRPKVDESGIPFISATENNNGITDYVARDGTKIFSAKSITVSNDGSVGNAFYQDKEFTCSHSVNAIRLHKKYNKDLNQFIALFLIPLIQKEKYRFGYGFKWRVERMKESKIKLPVDKDGNPDWKFMEDYIKSLPYSGSI